MKPYHTFYLLLIFSISAISQETETYKNIVNQTETIKIEETKTNFKNGSLKEVKSITTYEYNGIEYFFYSGEYVLYSKKGFKLLERTNNNFGSPLIIKAYDKGKLFEYSKTIELDTKAVSTEEFLNERRTVSIITENEEYLYDKKLNKSILYASGIRVNDKRSGVWKFYQNGKVVKTKTYKERNKFDRPLRSIIK